MTGIAPRDILEDEDLYASAIEQAEQAEWTGLHELLAQQIEMTHFLVRQTMRGQGVKRRTSPSRSSSNDPNGWRSGRRSAS
jgi:hypothetical protein